MLLPAQTLHGWSMFSTSWTTLAARNMNDGTAAEVEKTSADKLMDYLLSMMGHEVSQCCRIYQLEDVRV